MVAAASETVEIRLALVCYGGVSLAIYMSGITRELQELVTGSAARLVAGEAGPGGTAAVYGRLIHDLEDEAAGRGDPQRVRVGVDVVAGTSAGGINGICLTRALDGDYSQEAIRDFWITEGDFGKLLDPEVRSLLTAVRAEARDLEGIAGPLDKLLGPQPPRRRSWLRDNVVAKAFRRTRAAVRLRRPVTAFVKHPPESALSGDLMCRLTWGALNGMERHERAEALGLVFADGIDLAVTATEFAGHYDAVPLSHQLVFDEAHRHVFRVHGTGAGSLDPDVGMLAFAARSTASFPGAFAPVSIDHFRELLGPDGAAPGWGPIIARYLERYEGDGEAGGRRFVDGGVLDNMPFDAAIAAIRSRTSPAEVRRALVYVEPSPTVVENADALALKDLDLPSTNVLAETFRSVSTIPLSQTMGDQVSKVRRRNTDVDELRSVIEQSFDGVRGRVLAEATAAGSPSPLDGSALDVDGTWWRAVAERLHASDDIRPTYTRVKLSAVVDGLAGLVADAARYPEDSLQRELVRAVLRRAAVADGLLPRVGAESPASGVTAEQIEFLRTFDVGYERRRVSFVRDGIAWMYANAGAGAPTRAELSAVKAVVAERAAVLDGATATLRSAGDVAHAAARAFSPANLRELLPPPGDRPGWDADTALDAFVNEHADALRDLQKRAAEALGSQMQDFGRTTFEQLSKALAGCSVPAAARDLLVRHIGFPVWDAITYPIAVQRGVTERDGQIEIRRISPLETTGVLPPDGAPKLYGTGVHHFGAFFEERYRQNDYLWGRLDGCCQLVDLIVRRMLPGKEADEFDAGPYMRDACREALRQEWRRLDKVHDVAAHVWSQVATEAPPAWEEFAGPQGIGGRRCAARS
jgi:patatin-related protein